MHDNHAVIPLSMISAQPVTNLYDVMGSVYCSLKIHEHCRSLGHVPLIEYSCRDGEEEPFEPADARLSTACARAPSAPTFACKTSSAGATSGCVGTRRSARASCSVCWRWRRTHWGGCIDVNDRATRRPENVGAARRGTALSVDAAEGDTS